eukprot:TRINITY_DN95513_c0_g1_i1.p1 TRINITY_DN95513_c0_g1~~TRINITY_DN95513_c0_g1_i1.p1  ORF type:complete len:388 (-),score=77.19 TRINITY_DN95513_c0_g1_i1:121-1284(-)
MDRIRQTSTWAAQKLAICLVLWQAAHQLCWLGPSRLISSPFTEHFTVRSSKSQRLHRPRRLAPLEWVEMENTESLETVGNTTVLPVFPLRCVSWPGAHVVLKVFHPFQCKMYDDILMSGSRRFVVPFTGGMPVRRFHAVGSVFHLDDLQDLSEKSGGKVKYLAQHSVRGRARVLRVLNPRSSFEVDKDGLQTDYLRAEVQLLPDAKEARGEGPADAGLDDASSSLLLDAWQDLFQLASTLEEPRLASLDVIKEEVRKSSTWQLAYLWQQLQQQIRKHREKVKVSSALGDWIRGQQVAGRLPSQLPEQVDVSKIGVPDSLALQIAKVRHSDGTNLGSGFWDPFLRILATESRSDRGQLLVDEALEEVEKTRTRSLLRDIVGASKYTTL